jgi:hypothetical protein
MKSKACKANPDTDNKVNSLLEDDEAGYAEDEQKAAYSMEYVAAKRRLGIELEAAKKRLRKVQEDMRRAQNNIFRQKVHVSLISWRACLMCMITVMHCLVGTVTGPDCKRVVK